MQPDYNLVLLIWNVLILLLVCAIPIVAIIKISKWLLKSISRNLVPNTKK